MNIYTLSSWARATMIPLLIIAHHQPIYPLPNGAFRDNPYLDELWIEPADKMVPLGPSLLPPDLSKTDGFSLLFGTIDRALSWLGAGGLRRTPLRMYARRRCVQWITEHQEPSGDWAGIIPPMHNSVQALLLEGYSLDSDPVRRAVEAIERFTWTDGGGKRVQSCVSPVWDTVLMARALCDCEVANNAIANANANANNNNNNDNNNNKSRDDRARLLYKAVNWVKSRQLLGPEGDWRIYNPHLEPGGFSFEYHNSWYPDVDDTAAAILALVSQDPRAVDSETVVRAARWTCGMQNRDGGWAAFDVNNDKLWLNRIPFSDMDSLCDPSTADVTGRVLEAFGLIIRTSTAQEEEGASGTGSGTGGGAYVSPGLLRDINRAAERAIAYVRRNQEPSGAWYGRWGVNYVYGTSNVMCGLAYFMADQEEELKGMMSSGADWLKTVQNSDGGWGEDVQSYRDVQNIGRGSSTPSQTAWAVMALSTTCPPTDEALFRGVQYLVRSQSDICGKKGRSWLETVRTGTGFPNFFYLGYTLYRHYFPMMALGRFVSSSREHCDQVNRVLTNGHKEKPQNRVLPGEAVVEY